MEHIVLKTSGSPEVRLRVSGDLRVFGWEQNELHAEAEAPESVHVQSQDDSLSVRADSDCTVRLPRQARVILERVDGDTRVKSLTGALRVDVVNGDLVLRQTAGATIATVNGDISAKKIRGQLQIESVSGDVSARSVEGELEARSVGGDLYLREVSGRAAAEASGDIILNLAFAAGQEYAFECGGDMLVRLPPDASAKFDVESGGEITATVLGAKVEGNGHHKVITLGEGAAYVRLRASGEISLTGLSADPESMGDFGEHFGEEFGVMAEEFAAQIETQVETQIEAQMAEFEKHLSQHLGQLGKHVDAEKLAARAREAAERAGDRARRQAERQAEAARRQAEAAERRADRIAEAARRRAERHAERTKRTTAFAWKFDAPRPPRPPAPSKPIPPLDPVSEEERMTILRMVEQKKISVADAEKLLAALEGK